MKTFILRNINYNILNDMGYKLFYLHQNFGQWTNILALV